MLARLWWKDARLFWPLWLALGGIAVGAQWLLLQAGMSEVRQGILLPLALGWAALYAFAIGASAFAAEREMNTLIFLDTLPVARGALWNHKAAFALVTTLALALVLLGLAALGTTERDATRYSLAMIVLGYGAVVFEAVAWGLFWSVAASTALLAAVLSMATVALVAMVVSWDVIAWTPEMLERTALIRLVIALAALGASRVWITRPPRPDRLPRVRAARVRRSRPSVTRRLLWETVRESRWTWLLLFAVGFGLPNFGNAFQGTADPSLLLVFVPLVSLWAGVSVFGPENRARSYRFLVHHGVKPGKVWGTKVSLWLVVMAAPLALWGLAAKLLLSSPRQFYEAAWLLLLVANAFVVGLLCGQVMRRSITAWVVALLALFIVVPPQVGLYEAAMIPRWTLALPPLILLLVSRLWSDDWMYDLRGAARWRRLAGLLATSGALLIALYVGYRGWSVPLIDLPFDPATIQPASIPPEQNAADDYRQIVATYNNTEWPNGYQQGLLGTVRDPISNLNVRTESLIADVVDQGWDPENRTAVVWWEQNRGLIDRIKRAAAKPVAHFAEPETLEPETVRGNRGDFILTRLPSLALLLALDSRERQARGDLAGAWDDLRTVFRMASQLGQTATPTETLAALNLRQQALEWALEWSADPKQTPKLLRAALDDFRNLPPLAPFGENLKREYVVMERTIRRVSEEREALAGLISQSNGGKPSLAMRVLYAVVLAPPWERQRAERVLRLAIADRMRLATVDSWIINVRRRDPSYKDGLHWRHGRSEGFTSDGTLAWYTSGTPLIRFIGLQDDFEGTAYREDTLLSRAFEQVVALRIWQREHGGKYPETLDALVPGILPELPMDPFSGEPFLWKKAGTQNLLPLGKSGLFRTTNANLSLVRSALPGQRLLYSVGPDGYDGSAHHDYAVNPANGDLIFPLPD